ncbi:MAG: iron complex transport system substrate-binding protein [Chloroflexota bacterium]|nr:iron complex transport system substrate-binding protein [Chloroflexota bacterium]
MRIASLLPAATEIVIALGLDMELVGVTHRCRVPPGLGEVAVLTRPGSGGDELDDGALLDADPDLVIVGDGGSGTIGARAVESVFADDDDERPSVLTLAASSVEGVLNGIVAVGAMTESENAALDIVLGMRERLRGLEEIVVGRRDHGFQPPRVVLLAAVDPPRAVGGWIPDQVRLAGGWELLGQDDGPSEETSWDAVRDMDPEVLVLLPDGLPLREAIRAWESTPRPQGWADLRAVHDDRVFIVDGGPFVLAGPRVIDGIEILAELFDPVAFDGMSPPATWARAR